MLRILDGIPWIVQFGLIPYLIPVLMPTWRTLTGCVLLIGGGFAYLWIDHAIALQSPHYKEGPGGALGLAIVLIATTAFATGVVTRGLTLVSRAAGGSFGCSFAMSVAGFPVVIAIFTVPPLWDAWRLRPPSPSCTRATFQFDIAKARFIIPASPLLNVYLGPTSAADAYYLSLAPSLRELCHVTGDGTRATRATHVWLSVERNHGLYGITCTKLAGLGGHALCEALPAIARGHADDTDFPLDAHIFAPDEVRMGDFLATRSTYDDSLTGRSRRLNVEFLRSERVTPDGKPLTFACSPSGPGYFCQAAYAWTGGVHIDFRFRAAREEIIAKGERVDAATRSLFSSLRGPSK